MGAGSFFKKLLPFLSAATQFIPGAPALNIAANILTKASGEQVDNTPDAVTNILNKLTTTEEGRLKAQQAEQDYQKAMAELGFDHVEKMEQIATQDRDSARKREEVVKDLTPRVLAYLMLALACLVCVFILSGWSPAAKDATTAGLVGTVVGYVFSELKLVFAYYFGSSTEAEQSARMLYNSTPTEKGRE